MYSEAGSSEIYSGLCFRGVGSQRRSHSSSGLVSSGGSAHRLGGPRPDLQGPVAAAHPLHSRRPGEVRIIKGAVPRKIYFLQGFI